MAAKEPCVFISLDNFILEKKMWYDSGLTPFVMFQFQMIGTINQIKTINHLKFAQHFKKVVSEHFY